MDSFVHLHTHSNFSLLDSTIPLRALVERTKQLGMSAVALTDHNALYGAIEFYRICRELEIKPIIGAQVTLTDGASLVLLAKNLRGYRNLCEILTKAHLRGGHLHFKCEMNDVLDHKQGLFVLSGGKKGLISQLILSRNREEAEAHCRWMQERFGDRFFLELQRFVPWDDFLNERLHTLAETTGVPLVATNDVHLLSPEDLPLREVLHAIDRNTIRARVRTAGSKEQHLKSPWQMRRLFAKYPATLANTHQIAEACNVKFALGKPIFPVTEVPDGENGASYLRKLCLRGAKERYRPLTRQVKKRIDYELKVIDDMGFTDYFLIVKEIVDFCRREAIPCVGRGSAADSIVSYVLAITFADPIRFNLYFERFLNPERTDAPDIDLDICWKSRDRVLEHVYKRFGKEKTAMICTFSTFQSRAAIREVAKVFGLPEEEIGQLTREVPYMSKMVNLDRTLNSVPQLKNGRRIDRTFWKIIKISKRLAGFPRHLSVHSGGVIIAPDRLTNYTPLEVAGKGIVISQYDMYSIERLGLVKMDLLGVRSLTIITECLEMTKSEERKAGSGDGNEDGRWKMEAGSRWSEKSSLQIGERGASSVMGGEDKPAKDIPISDLRFPDSETKPETRNSKLRTDSNPKFSFLRKAERLSALDMRAIPDDDPETIGMIKAGQTLGCFQLESPLVRGVLRKMQTDSVEDMVVAVAVIRPGVGDSGIKDEYILRRGGKRPTRYTHPILESVLRETHGLTIYQEQVLLIAQAVAGFSLAQGDTLRRAMTKNRDQELMNSMKKQFLAGAHKKGVPKEKALEIWQFLLQFTGFGFNKAHAATYGILAYQTAFLKNYFPIEYMTAVLNNPGGFYASAVYIEECRRMGIPLLPPDVNQSENEFTKESDAIRVGLAPVFELCDKTRKRIVTERKKRRFVDLYDFLQRTRTGEKEAEHLIRCGALRSLHPSEPLLLMKCQSYFKNNRSKPMVEYLTAGFAPTPYPQEMQILAELEILGFGVKAHPLTLYDGLIPWENMVSSLELEAHKNRKVQFTGWYVTSRLQETVTGKYMKFISLEDKHGICEVIFFPEAYAKYADILRGHGPFTVVGKVQSRIKGEANLIAERVLRWDVPREVVNCRMKTQQIDLFQKRLPPQPIS
ncbi:MAG: DNA polymerase III subunit alpha [Calditrichaeota bacterium]|nr:DNA polymerase III subunit alpha [Calditrichota bacterium]